MTASGERPAYLIADIDVRDAKRYADYRDTVPALIAKHGGRYLVRGAEVRVLEGDWRPRRFVLMQFPSRRALDGFLDDPDYAPLRALRHEVADSNVLAVDGVGG